MSCALSKAGWVRVFLLQVASGSLALSVGTALINTPAKAGAYAFAGVSAFGPPYFAGGGVILVEDNTQTQNLSSTEPFFASTEAAGFYNGTVTAIDGGASYPVHVGGTAAAYASLASGQLRARAATDPDVDVGSPLIASLSAESSATARLDDTLYFAVPAALRLAPVFVTISMHVHGFTNSAEPIGAAELTTSGLDSHFNEVALDTADTSFAIRQAEEVWDGTSTAPISLDAALYLTGGLLLPGGGTTDNILNGTYGDFFHTATLSISAPPGVTFTSQSGAFLTRPTEVPEPSSLAIIMAGTAALWGARRGRSKRSLGAASILHG